MEEKPDPYLLMQNVDAGAAKTAPAKQIFSIKNMLNVFKSKPKSEYD